VYTGVATASAYVYIRVYVSWPSFRATYTPVHGISKVPSRRGKMARIPGAVTRDVLTAFGPAERGKHHGHLSREICQIGHDVSGITVSLGE